MPKSKLTEPSIRGKVRIGIDVGGTFTDVVVIDQQTRELVGQLKLPTTHGAREGVALGIVSALEQALTRFGLLPEDVTFIAHSTTQATNALLEGDVATVAVIGVGAGVEGWLARRATRVPPIALTPQRRLEARHVWLDTTTEDLPARVRAAIAGLAGEGVEVIVATEAFGVDQTAREVAIADEARAAGLLATSGHEVSRLYGLRVRTRTAVINAAILPKMIATATMTERCVRETGIDSPLMIMRSDGGVMSVGEVHHRPILTMLSGPAAGIAGALMHERISDGIFIEVGGTSADISVIRDGRPAMRPARLNGHRMYLDTLDVRTLGVGGGSMIRVAVGARTLADVGPRSAHIAGLGYACFTEPERLATAVVEIIQPTARDEPDHVVLRMADGGQVAITTTCAANLLGLVGDGQFARGRIDSATLAFDRLADWLGRGQRGEEVAREVLHIGCQKIVTTIDELIAEYQLPRDQVVLVGGGGGAASLVPGAAELMGLDHRIARNAEVISPIGVAMAMVRDTVERNIVDPTPADILEIRREAAAAAVNAGALPESVEVEVQVDKRRNLVRAVAMGTTELRRMPADGVGEVIGDVIEHCRLAAARSIGLIKTGGLETGQSSLAGEDQYPRLVAQAGNYLVFTATLRARFRRPQPRLRVVDRSGVVRLQRGAARVAETTPTGVNDQLTSLVEELTDYGDAGRTIPDIFLIYGNRLANFSGLADLEQVQALVEVELRSLDPATPLVVIACSKHDH